MPRMPTATSPISNHVPLRSRKVRSLSLREAGRRAVERRELVGELVGTVESGVVGRVRDRLATWGGFSKMQQELEFWSRQAATVARRPLKLYGTSTGLVLRLAEPGPHARSADR